MSAWRITACSQAGRTEGVETAEQAASAKDPTRRRMAKGMERLHVYFAGPPDADEYRQHASGLLRRAGPRPDRSDAPGLPRPVGCTNAVVDWIRVICSEIVFLHPTGTPPAL
jgi:hypothetical protein